MTASIGHPQAGVEPLFDGVQAPDPLAAARDARRRQAAARQAFREARERYLGAHTELSIAKETGKPKDEIHRLWVRACVELHKDVQAAQRELDASYAAPARRRRR